MTKKKLIGAILLNFFVLPGAGHALIKRKLRGFFFGGAVVLVLAALFLHITIVAIDLMHTKPIDPAIDIMAASEALSRNLLTEMAFMMKVYLSLLCVFYFWSIGDLVWIYKKGRLRTYEPTNQSSFAKATEDKREESVRRGIVLNQKPDEPKSRNVEVPTKKETEKLSTDMATRTVDYMTTDPKIRLPKELLENKKENS